MWVGEQVTFCGYNLTAHFATLKTQNEEQAFLGAVYRTPRMNRSSSIRINTADSIAWGRGISQTT